MVIKELLSDAIKNNYVDLQALIMFLVFEKEVLNMEDDAKELDVYFSVKHNQRMNKELVAYKHKMNIGYGLRVYEIKNTKETNYVLAYSEKQARFIASGHLIQADHITICDLDQLMTYNDLDMTFKSLIRNKKPCLLGGY